MKTRQGSRNARFDYDQVSDVVGPTHSSVVSCQYIHSGNLPVCECQFGFLCKLDVLSPYEIECSAEKLVTVYQDNLEQFTFWQ